MWPFHPLSENVIVFPCPLTELPEEKEKVKKAADHCRQVLNHVNQAVKESENKQVGGEGSKHQGQGEERQMKGKRLLKMARVSVLVTVYCALWPTYSCESRNPRPLGT